MNTIIALSVLAMLNLSPKPYNDDQLDFIANMCKIHGNPNTLAKVGTSVYMYYPTEIYELTKEGEIGEFYVLRDNDWVFLGLEE